MKRIAAGLAIGSNSGDDMMSATSHDAREMTVEKSVAIKLGRGLGRRSTADRGYY